MIVEFALAAFASLVCHMAGIAAHVQRRMTAAPLRDVQANLVAGKTEIALLAIAARRLKQLILIVGLVRIVTFHAVTDGRRVNSTLIVSCFLV
jgi:hypothetical protein